MNPENNKPKPMTRQQKIEAFLLDPEKTIFQSLEEFQADVARLLEIFEGVDISSLEQLVGEDGKTPVRGEDYFTDEDLQAIEDFIISKVPVVGKDLPSVAQVVQYIQAEVAKIPRVKGDPGKPGKPGAPGKNGSPDTPAEIISKLRSLPRNQRLGISDIRGLQNVLKSYKEAIEEIPELRRALEDTKVVIPVNNGDGSSSSLAITYSDTEPASPSDGDLWVDTSVQLDLPVTSADIRSIVALTQAEYDALGSYDAETFYIITA